MGLNTIAIARRHEKEKLSRQLNAGHYIDVQDSGKAAVALGDLGGADLSIATASSRASSSALIGDLATNGKLIVLGASKEPVTVTTGDLIGRGIHVLGCWSTPSLSSKPGTAATPPHPGVDLTGGSENVR